jgi:hypothetical protein
MTALEQELNQQGSPVRTMRSNLRLASVAALVVCLALLGLVLIRRSVDFPVYYLAGRSLLRGSIDLYSPGFSGGPLQDYRYPPVFVLIFSPLSTLPYQFAAYLWYSLSVGGVIMSVVALRRFIEHGQLVAGSHKIVLAEVWIIALLTTGPYFVLALHYGNVHPIVIVLLFGSFYLALRNRSAVAGLLMALAVTIKLTPLVILPYFALKRQWKFLCAVGVFLVAINLLPAVYFGPRKNWELLQTWYHHVVVNQGFHELNTAVNLSLKGQLRRYLTRVDYAQRVTTDRDYPAVNLASLDPQSVNRLWQLFALVISVSTLILIWWTSRPTRARLVERDGPPCQKPDRQGGQPDPGHLMSKVESAKHTRRFAPGSQTFLELGLMICLMLLVAPLTIKIYFTALLWPTVALARLELVRPPTRYALPALAILNCVLSLLPGSSTQRLLLVVGVDFYVNCIIMALLAYAMIASEHRGGAALASRP